MQEQRTFSQLDCDMWQKVDFIQQPAMISSVVGPRSFKALPKAKPAPKEDQSYCLVVCWPSDHKFCESRQNHYIWEVCSSNRRDAQKLQHLQLVLVNRRGPILLCNNAQLCVTKPTLRKLNKLGYEVLPHPPNSPDRSLTDYHFFKHFKNFLQGQCFHNLQEAENTWKDLLNPEAQILML